jgi:hypothetical protein
MRWTETSKVITMDNQLLKVLSIAGSCLLLAAGADAAPAAKADVCHAPPDNPLNTKHIRVGGKGGAVPDHLSHGDWLVSEEMCDAIPDNDCDGVPDPVADDADCVAQLGIFGACIAGICDIPPDTPVGSIMADINRGGTPPGKDRGVESAAGNLVADAQQWATSFNGAEIAFVNPESMRSDLIYLALGSEGDGVVTFGEALTFQPFGNTLKTFPMTGDQIVSVLEEQCQPLGSSRPILHLGVSEGFTYDLATTVVARDCTSVTVSNVMLKGVPLTTSGTYTVTVNSRLSVGGDNFGTFDTIPPSEKVDGGLDLQAIINYLSTFGPVAPPSTDRVNEN